MAAASIRPDTEFQEQDRTTAAWHYIDICLQDSERDLPPRCQNGNCVTAEIDEYARRLKDGDYDKAESSYRKITFHKEHLERDNAYRRSAARTRASALCRS